MTYSQIEAAAGAEGLIVMGALREDGTTLILLGAGAAFWDVFQASPEATDGQKDPVDRWSARVLGAMARRFRAEALFPFGGPPYAPFIAWAKATGRAFSSPTGMLVHDEVGLMISYRGALRLPQHIDFPEPSGVSPCDSCTSQPCLTACPVGALAATRSYDLDACHRYLDTVAGQDCMISGCAARRACPISAGARRQPEQSALHMRSFHKT